MRKEWDADLHKWVGNQEITPRQKAMGQLVNRIGADMAAQDLTIEEMKVVFECVRERLTIGGFSPIMEGQED